MSAKRQPDLYLAVRVLGGTIKATIHTPRPLNYRTDGDGSASPTTQKAKRPGPLSSRVAGKAEWPGAQFAAGVTLEWRVYIFGPPHIRDEPLAVDDRVRLLRPPTADEVLQVGVFLGHDAELEGSITGDGGLLAEGRLANGGPVWVIYSYHRAEPQPLIKVPEQLLPAVRALDQAELRNLRACGVNVEPDGSLKFLDFRTEPPSAD